MESARDSGQYAVETLCDGLKFVGDVSYALLPEDIAHAVGDLKKALLSNIRGLIDWKIDWINERVQGGDKLREEWRQKCHDQATVPPTETF